MKLAKKTLSVALAAVMAASSLAGATSAFAAIEAKAVEQSAVKYTAITGSATVKPNVTIDNKYAKTTVELKDATNDEKTANMLAQVDPTSLNSYYSFTPSKTGYYNMYVESTPVYYGYSVNVYNKYNTNQYTEDQKIEACHVYASKPDGLYSEVTKDVNGKAVFAKSKALTEASATDSVTISNITSPEDKDATTRDEFVKTATTVESKTNGKTTHVLSYKYTKFQDNDYIIPDKTVDEKTTGAPVALKDALLVAGKTYYFKATLKQATVIGTEEVKGTKDGSAVTFVKTVKSTAAPSAKISISMNTGMGYGVEYKTVEEKDYQVLACPQDTSITIGSTTYTSAYDAKYGKNVVKLPVEKAEATATYFGNATTATVADTFQGAEVKAFDNLFKGLQTITLGKNVETVSGLSKSEAPQLKSVVVKNPNFTGFAGLGVDVDKVTFTVPSNSKAYIEAIGAGYKVNVTCAHKWVVTKAATIFATGVKKCSECDATATVAKVRFAPTAKASKKKIVVKGNAGKVAKLAVWVYNSNGKLVKKQVKKNVTKNTVKVAKAGKYTVKVKAYGTKGAKTASVKKTVKVK